MDRSEIGHLLKRLVTVDGPSGAEERVAALVQELSRDVAEDVRIDALGNVIARKAAKSSNPAGRIMLAAHMDEIGLIVTRVEGSFLYVGRVGGVEPRSLLAQEVTVYPSGSGREQYPAGIPGYIGSRPPHVLSAEERDKVVPLDTLRVDIGSEQSARAVRVGDRIAVRGPYTELLGGRVSAKALDNRASVAAILAALAYLGPMQHTWDVYAVATVQEEVGVRGAITSAYGLVPDLAIAIDVTFASTPGLDDSETVEMDKGPSIGWGPNLHPGVVKRLREVAEALEIPYVNEAVPGASGTDAWAIQVSREGIPCALLGIPIRYMHSAVEMLALPDLDRTARLLAAFIGRLDGDFLARLPEEV